MINLNKILEQHNLKAEEITKIYYGGDHVCRCGCKGHYADRGTPLFKRYLRKMAEMDVVDEIEIAGNKYWLNIPVDNSMDIGKCFCLYFKED